ncbi:MAG: hypothetical protein P1U46_04870 [Patescibacteria group bacterium]|nr:hypothetical protein [Patescibacteria group bacterium]
MSFCSFSLLFNKEKSKLLSIINLFIFSILSSLYISSSHILKSYFLIHEITQFFLKIAKYISFPFLSAFIIHHNSFTSFSICFIFSKIVFKLNSLVCFFSSSFIFPLSFSFFNKNSTELFIQSDSSFFSLEKKLLKTPLTLDDKFKAFIF